MARIQDIHQFEELICDTVNEYLQEKDCYTNPVLAVYRRCGQLNVVIDDQEKLKLPKDSKTYPIEKVVRPSEDYPDQLESDCDGISYVANEWIFIEH